MGLDEPAVLSGLLQSSPAVIKAILTPLSTRELLRMSRVCKAWRFYGCEIQGKRRWVEKFVAGKTSRTPKNMWTALADMEEVNKYLTALEILSKNVIVFGHLPQSRPCIGGHDLTALHSTLPPTTSIFGFLSAQGIIGTNAEGQSSEIQKPQNECLSSIVLPDFGEAGQIVSFSLSMDRHEKLFGGPSDTEIPESALTEHFGIPQGVPVRALILVLADYFPVDIGVELAKAFWKREKGNIALCGGVAENVLAVRPFGKITEEPGLQAIAICGEKVKAASVTAPSNVRRKSGFRAKIKGLSAQIGPVSSSRSFGFLFTCVARGKNIYKEEGVEAGIFREYFPHTPVAGLFSMGEYGWDGVGRTGVSSQDSDLPPTLLAYTTVAAVVSLPDS